MEHIVNLDTIIMVITNITDITVTMEITMGMAMLILSLVMRVAAEVVMDIMECIMQMTSHILKVKSDRMSFYSTKNI